MYAKDDRLEALRKVLREMRISGINTSDKFIDERIAARAAKRLQSNVISLVSDDESDNDAAQATNWTPEDLEGHDRLRVDKEAVSLSQRFSDHMKAVWSDPEFRAQRSESAKEMWKDPTYRAHQSSASTARWEDPEQRAQHSRIMTAVWEDDDYKERASAAMKLRWRDPMYRTERSEEMKARWKDPAYKQRVGDSLKLIMQNPEKRARQSTLMKAHWQDETYRETQLATIRTTNADPQYRENMSVVQKARWQAPGNEQLRQEHSDILMFKRDDTNPTFKKAWDARIAAADKYVAKKSTKTSFYRAFAILRLDPAPYNVDIPSNFRRRPTLKATPEDWIRSAFFVKAQMTGAPFFTSMEVENIGKQMKWTGDKARLRELFNMEVECWVRAAAYMRKHSISVDYASIPHLAWMA